MAGLLDGDKTADAEKLSQEFPLFFFTCIPAADIRTKPARKPTEEVAGLLDEQLNVKPEFTEALKNLFGELSKHMSAPSAG